METAKRKKRSFTPEYRAGAVKLVIDEGKTVAQVSRDLDLVPSALAKWVKQARIDAGSGPTGALTTAEREELARLKKENRELRMERELLKKWAAFFAKENA